MGVGAWALAQAKAKLSEVIDKARTLGPQTITRNGRKAAVVVAADGWERKNRRKGNLAEFFASSPLRRIGLKIGRLRSGVVGLSEPRARTQSKQTSQASWA